jgi:hypothetical protein
MFDVDAGHDSIVTVVTRPQVGQPGIQFPVGTRCFVFYKHTDKLWGTPSPLFVG